MFDYAKIDENSMVTGLVQSYREVDDPNFIPIDFYDISLLRATYNKETGEFIPASPLEPIPPQPNPIEQLQQDQNAVMLGLLDLYNQQQQSEDKRIRDSDAVMMGMMDLYKQVQELKAKIEGGA